MKLQPLIPSTPQQCQWQLKALKLALQARGIDWVAILESQRKQQNQNKQAPITIIKDSEFEQDQVLLIPLQLQDSNTDKELLDKETDVESKETTEALLTPESSPTYQQKSTKDTITKNAERVPYSNSQKSIQTDNVVQQNQTVDKQKYQSSGLTRISRQPIYLTQIKSDNKFCSSLSPPLRNRQQSPTLKAPFKSNGALQDIPAGLLIFQSFIILQKQRNGDFSPEAVVHFSGEQKTNQSILQLLYRFTFTGPPKILLDDQMDSRKNLLSFGNVQKQIIYVFDNALATDSPPLLVKMLSLRKRFFCGLLKPQIVYWEDEPGVAYETEVLYGFITESPFSNLFISLSKAVIQQAKLTLLLNPATCQIVQCHQRTTLIAESFNKLHSQIKQFGQNRLWDFPVKCSINLVNTSQTASVTYPSPDEHIRELHSKVESYLDGFSLLGIVRALHCLLSEKSLLLVVNSQHESIRAVELLRCLIYPLQWNFAIIYNYHSDFEPFLSSPLPIVMTVTEQILQTVPPDHQLITLYLQDPNQDNTTIPEEYWPSIAKLYRKVLMTNHQRQFNPSSSSVFMNSFSQTTVPLPSLMIGSLQNTNMSVPSTKEIVERLLSFTQGLLRLALNRTTINQMTPFLYDFQQTQIVSVHCELQKEHWQKIKKGTINRNSIKGRNSRQPLIPTRLDPYKLSK